MPNFLNLVCPACGADAHIDIAAHIWVRITEHGTDPDLSECRDHEYHPLSPAICWRCRFIGKVRDFERWDAHKRPPPSQGAPRQHRHARCGPWRGFVKDRAGARAVVKAKPARCAGGRASLDPAANAPRPKRSPTKPRHPGMAEPKRSTDMNDHLEFQLRLSPACGCDPINERGWGTSAEEVMDDLVREGTKHLLSFFYLKLKGWPHVDELDLLNDDGTVKYRYRSSWLRLRLWLAELRRQDVVVLNGRRFHRGQA